MQLKNVLSVLDSVAPFESAEQWDNVGLMVGDPLQDISSILVSLDATDDVIETARSEKIDLIITHHPLIFHPLKKIDLTDNISRKIGKLIRTGISLISIHTNFDSAHGGVADILAENLSLQDVKSYGLMKIGMIEDEMPLSIWARSLPFESMRLVDAGRPVKSVCACPGSGMDFLWNAREMGCDTLVTGDVRYHAALEARESGMNVIDLGHFNTEQIAMAPLAERLGRDLPGVSIQVYKTKDIFTNIKGEQS